MMSEELILQNSNLPPVQVWVQVRFRNAVNNKPKKFSFIIFSNSNYVYESTNIM